MDTLLFDLAVMQLGLPLMLVLANLLFPAASRATFALRSLALLVLLAYLALAGLWLFPPWWTPYGLIALHLLVVLLVYRRRAWHVSRSGWRWLDAAIGTSLMAGALALILPAVAGRTPPDVAADLAMPLGPGRYLVISGGAAPSLNVHLATLTLERAAAFRGQSYGVDIIAVDPVGRRAEGILPRDPAAYEIYGRAVRAPCAGTVIHLSAGVSDNPVPEMNRDRMTGNSVLLACGAVEVLLAHFAPGSLAVQLGDQVEVGQMLGRVGNSGNSGEPHLHIHVQSPGPAETPFAGAPLWFTVEGDFWLRNMRFAVAD